MVLEAGHQSHWDEAEHSIVLLILNGSLSPDVCGRFNNTQNATQLYAVIDSAYRWHKQMKKRILAVLRCTIFFLQCKVQLPGFEVHEEEEVFPEEWLEYLSVPHCLFVALFGKLLNIPAVNENVKRDMQQMLIKANLMVHDDHSIWQLAQLLMDSMLLTDMSTLERLSRLWAGPHLFSRCKARLPELFDKGDELSYHVGTRCHVVVVNEFEEADFRASARGDVEAVREMFSYEKVPVLFNKSLDDLRERLSDEKGNVVAGGPNLPPHISDCYPYSNDHLLNARKVCVWISSHGSKFGSFCCNDGKEMEVVELVNLILKSAKHVDTVYVMVQACQGLALVKEFSEEVTEECETTQWDDNFPEKLLRKDVDVYMLHSYPGCVAPSFCSPSSSGYIPSPFDVASECSFMFGAMRKLNRRATIERSMPYQLQNDAAIPDMLTKVLSEYKTLNAHPFAFRAVLEHFPSSAM